MAEMFDLNDAILEMKGRPSYKQADTRNQKASTIFDSLKSHVSQKSKLEIFQKLNKTLAPDEVLINDFSCILHKDLPVHGRLYLSQYALTFYANTLGFEKTIVLKWDEVDAITREKSAKLIPNAVQVVLSDETYFFSSFLVREEAYTSMVRVWQNARMGFPMLGGDLQALCQKKIALTSSVPEEGICEKIYEMSKNQGESANNNTNKLLCTSRSVQSQIKDKRLNLSYAIARKLSQVNIKGSSNAAIDTETGPDIPVNKLIKKYVDSIIGTMKIKVGVTPSTVLPSRQGERKLELENLLAEEGGKDNSEVESTITTIETSNAATNSLSTMNNGATNSLPAIRRSCLGSQPVDKPLENNFDHNNNDMFSAMESNHLVGGSKEVESIKLEWVDTHVGDEYLNEEFDISIDDLYQHLFSQDSKTMRAVFDQLKYENTTFTPLRREEDGSHSQTLTYTIPLSQRQCNTTTKHVMLNTNTPGRFYVVAVTSRTEGVPYGDAFHVRTRYCLTKSLGTNRSWLRVMSKVVFNKPVVGFLKNLIISSTCKGVIEYLDVLANSLKQETIAQKHETNANSPPEEKCGMIGGMGSVENTRNISNIFQRVKVCKKSLMSEKKNEGLDKGRALKEKKLPSVYITAPSVFLTFVFFYLINRYLLY